MKSLKVSSGTLPATHRLGKGPDFANSCRFHFAPFQHRRYRQPPQPPSQPPPRPPRRSGNRSTSPRFHACRAVAWRRRVHSATPSQIVEDRLPRRHERVSFRQVPSAGRPRIRALPKLPPSQRPQIQSDLWPVRAKPLALRLPARHKATARVSPCRQKSARAAPRPDQRQQHCAAPKNPRTTADMPAIARPVESFRNKAELGNVDAQWRLGLMYHSGQGVTKSEAEAQKWYLESG